MRPDDDDVEAIADAGDLERVLNALTAGHHGDPLVVVAQLVDPGDRAGEWPHVAVAEVGRDRLEREDRRVERLVVDPHAQQVERGDDRARPSGVEGVAHLLVMM